MIDLKLRGHPWNHNEIVQDSLEVKELVGALIKHMKAIDWQLLIVVQLRSYVSGHPIFFVKRHGLFLPAEQQQQPMQDASNSASLTPYRKDRLLLQHFDTEGRPLFPPNS